MKYRRIVEILLAHGFLLDRQRGSHRQYEAMIEGTRRLVTISGSDNDDVTPKTLSSIIRQSGLGKGEFRQ